MEAEALKKKFDEIKSRGLNLDMSRGKPNGEQLNLSNPMLNARTYVSANGTDCRNYGGLDGLYEMRKIFSEILGVKTDEIIAGGNSSLTLMHDAIARAVLFGLPVAKRKIPASDMHMFTPSGNPETVTAPPWKKGDKFICPVPGYDRHFAITEHFGFEMINVPMLPSGPDMDAVEKIVRSDTSVKGIWNVPKYSNPTGITYSDETVRRFAQLKPAAYDFRIFWDNAYCIHDLNDTTDTLLNILTESKKYDNDDLVYIFASTSKVTFPGSGVSAIAANKMNIADIKKHMFFQTIGNDKMNQLRHAFFLKDLTFIKSHMKKLARALKPKFDIVISALEQNLKPENGKTFGTWSVPNGGYFISFNGNPGTAKHTVALCKEAGVILTAAGATFPLGKDPLDQNIRIAPTYPSEDELKTAMEVFCICVKLAAL